MNNKILITLFFFLVPLFMAPQDVASQCVVDADCDDSNPCTIDTCTACGRVIPAVVGRPGLALEALRGAKLNGEVTRQSVVRKKDALQLERGTRMSHAVGSLGEKYRAESQPFPSSGRLLGY